jgi:hypothetical protein
VHSENRDPRPTSSRTLVEIVPRPTRTTYTCGLFDFPRSLMSANNANPTRALKPIAPAQLSPKFRQSGHIPLPSLMGGDD